MSRLNLVVFTIMLTIGGGLIPNRFAVTLSESVPYRVFFLKRNTVPNKGDYALVRGMSFPFINDGKEFSVIKKVSCVSGEILLNNGGNYWCNKTFLGTAKEFSLKGDPLNQFDFSGEVPEGKVFLAGTHKDSFDSRYFGFVDINRMEAVCVPIL